MNATQCVICTELYSEKNRKVVRCLYCNYEACRVCCEQYILTKGVPTCMNNECEQEWSLKFILSTLSTKFVKGAYRQQRENLYLETEMALMPSTQPVVEEIIKLEKQCKKMKALTSVSTGKLEKRIESLITNRVSLDAETESDGVIKSCPKNGCRGFLTKTWSCGVCQTKVCSACLVVKFEGKSHECKADDVATAEFLKTDTKQCPKCPARIHKIDGCDQMWCVKCKTAFSWKTGQVVHGMIHNPHYFQWMRENRQGVVREERNPNDILCGREMDHQVVNSIAQLWESRHSRMVPHDLQAVLENFLYFCEKTNAFPVFDALDNRRQRIAYMRNEIDSEDFKKFIFTKQKRNEMNREIRTWLILFRDVTTELVYNLEEKLRNPMVVMTAEEMRIDFLEEVGAIEKMVNENLNEFCKLMGITARRFRVGERNSYWNLTSC